jgi:hypothetical protein
VEIGEFAGGILLVQGFHLAVFEVNRRTQSRRVSWLAARIGRSLRSGNMEARTSTIGSYPGVSFENSARSHCAALLPTHKDLYGTTQARGGFGQEFDHDAGSKQLSGQFCIAPFR